MNKELTDIKKEFITDRKKVIFQLHTDIMFYDMKAKDFGDEDAMRSQRKELFNSLDTDKEDKARKTPDNETKIEQIKELDGKIDMIIKNEDQKIKQQLQLTDFELYLNMVNNLTKEQIKELEEAISKCN